MRSRARFLIAIGVAVCLGGWLAWTSFGGSLETYASPSQLTAGDTYRLNGIVAKGAPEDAAERAQSADGLTFQVRDKENPGKLVTVSYRGTVPDTFKAGREIVVTGALQGGTFVGERNTLVALCPSKFTDDPEQTMGAEEARQAGHPESVPLN